MSLKVLSRKTTKNAFSLSTCLLYSRNGIEAISNKIPVFNASCSYNYNYRKISNLSPIVHPFVPASTRNIKRLQQQCVLVTDSVCNWDYYLGVRFASKKAKGKKQKQKGDDNSVDGGSEKDKVKGKSGDEELPYDFDEMVEEMNDQVSRLDTQLQRLLSRVGRVSPVILDPVKIELDRQRYPLQDFATVSINQGNLMVQVYDEAHTKLVSESIMSANLNLNPIDNGGQTLKVPVPRVDDAGRMELRKQAGTLRENTRNSIRKIGQNAKKKLKNYKLATKRDSLDIDQLTSNKSEEADKKLKQAEETLAKST